MPQYAPWKYSCDAKGCKTTYGDIGAFLMVHVGDKCYCRTCYDPDKHGCSFCCHKMVPSLQPSKLQYCSETCQELGRDIFNKELDAADREQFKYLVEKLIEKEKQDDELDDFLDQEKMDAYQE